MTFGLIFSLLTATAQLISQTENILHAWIIHFRFGCNRSNRYTRRNNRCGWRSLSHLRTNRQWPGLHFLLSLSHQFSLFLHEFGLHRQILNSGIFRHRRGRLSSCRNGRLSHRRRWKGNIWICPGSHQPGICYWLLCSTGSKRQHPQQGHFQCTAPVRSQR